MRIGKVLAASVAAACVAAPLAAWAWGATGHRLIAQLAVAALPAEVPAFLRDAAADVGEYAREPDRSKGSGDPHDADLDPAHYINLDDAGLAAGVVGLAKLPPTREAFDAALNAAGTSSHDAGYLPYAMAGAWQQLVTDFAYWRIARWGEAHAADGGARAWFAADRKRREALILRDVGVYAHYVGDGAQPLHVTTHHNGWTPQGPDGFTTARIHARVEGYFVKRFMQPDAVRAAMTPYRARSGNALTEASSYLAETAAEVRPLYALDKAGGFADGDTRGATYSAARLAAGASETRDRVLDAWRASATAKVGYPAVSVADVEAGRTDALPSVFGKD